MNTPSFPRLLVLLAGLPLVAGAADWQSLTSNSPFGSAPAPTAAATGDLEFRGVVQEEGVYLVNLYNPTTKTAQWIPVNGKVAGLEVKSYDEANGGKVSITQGGRTLNLPMKQARVTLAAAAPAPAGGPGANGENGNGNGNDNGNDRRAQMRARLENGPNGEPSPFVRSLPPEAQAMIEEFRRRRAEGGGGNGGNGNQGGQGAIQFQQATSVQGQTQQAQQTQGQGQGQRRRERPQN